MYHQHCHQIYHKIRWITKFITKFVTIFVTKHPGAPICPPPSSKRILKGPFRTLPNSPVRLERCCLWWYFLERAHILFHMFGGETILNICRKALITQSLLLEGIWHISRTYTYTRQAPIENMIFGHECKYLISFTRKFCRQQFAPSTISAPGYANNLWSLALTLNILRSKLKALLSKTT